MHCRGECFIIRQRKVGAMHCRGDAEAAVAGLGCH